MASLQEYALQNQLRTSATEAVQRGAAALGEGFEYRNKMKQEEEKKANAAQASQLWQEGKKDDAMAMLMRDPDFAQHIAAGYAGQEGKLGADQKYGQLPTQVNAAKAKDVVGPGFKDTQITAPDGTVYNFSKSKKDGLIYSPLDGHRITMDEINTIKEGSAPVQGYASTVRTNPNTGGTEIVSKNGKAKDVAESGAAIESDAQGQAVALTPKQNEGLKKFTDEFNKDKQTIQLTDQINNLNTAKEAIIKNVPGAGMLEKMRLIRGMTPRPAVQEVMALNYGQGWETTVEGYMTKASGKGLAPEEQKNFLNMIDVFQKANLDEYNQHLHSRVGQASENLKQGDKPLDSMIIMKRVAGSAPTPIQAALQEVSKLPPEEQKVIDMAHQYLLNHDRSSPDYQDALKVLRMHGL